MSVSTQKSIFRLAVIAAAVLAVQSFAALPVIKVTTANDQALGVGSQNNTNQGGGIWGGGWGGGFGTTTNKNYVRITGFTLTDPSNPANNISNRSNKPDSIKIRGNSTASAAKKPYKLHFSEKLSLFGKEPAKSWVLLANFYDATFALNAMAFELGKKMGLEFTNSSQLVELYIGNTYMGVYQLTEQVQSHKGRVDLKENKRGWLVEFDYHTPEDNAERQTNFTTSKYNFNTYIKSPQLDDTAFTKNPNDASQLNFVKNDVNNLMNKMSENGFPENGYRDLIDLESFAKYVLIQMVLDNFDFISKAQSGVPGSNFCYRVDSAKTTKIKAGPLWDFDLAAGVTQTNFPQHFKTYQEPFYPQNNTQYPFYPRLWADPVFKAKYLKLWLKHKNDFTGLNSFIENLKNQTSGSVVSKDNGKNLWAGANASMMSMTGVELTSNDFNTQVNNLKTWWTNRLNWVDQQFKSLNIDTTKDIKDPVVPPSQKPSSIAGVGFGKAGNGIAVVKNGLKINAGGNASMKVVSLNGGVVRTQAFSGGNHTVSLGDLPRGMYLVRVNLDGVKQTVKVAVR